MFFSFFSFEIICFIYRSLNKCVDTLAHTGGRGMFFAMKRCRKEFGLRFQTGLLCVLTVFVVSHASAGTDTVSFRLEESVLLGQRSVSSLFLPGFRGPLGTSPTRTWLRSFGNWTHISDSIGTTDAKAYGVSLGLDRQFGRNFLVGVGLGGSWCSAENGPQNETVDVSAFHGSLYSRVRVQRLYFDLEGGLGSNNDKRSSQSSSTAFQGNFNGEVGTWWELGLAKLEPYFGIRQVWFDDRSVRIGNKTTSVLGCRYSWQTVGSLAVTTPRVYYGWLHEWNDRDLVGVGTFTDAQTVYRLSGTILNRDRLFVGGGFTTVLGTSLDVYLRYTAEVASNSAAHTLLLGMNWNF